VDSYTLQRPAGAGLQVLLRHDPSLGDLSLTLRAPGAPGVRLDHSDSPYGVERVGDSPDAEAEDLLLEVRGRPGGHVPYMLSVQTTPPEGCLPDVHDLLGGNEDAAHAVPVQLGEHHLALCPGDEDWLALRLPAGTRLAVSVQGPALLAGGVAATVLGPAGQELGAAVLDLEEAELAVDVVTTGEHLLRLALPPGATGAPFSVRLGATGAPAAAAAACDEAVALVPGEPRGLPTTLPVVRFELACDGLDEADYVARFRLDEPSRVRAQVLGAHALALRSACPSADSELACVSGGDPVLDMEQLDAGTWYLVWAAGDEVPSTALLEVFGACAGDGDCHPGQVCAGGRCAPPCEGDVDCAGQQTCLVPTGHCQEPPRCEADADCLGLRRCHHDGSCFVPECDTHAECAPGRCVERRCDDAPLGDCVADLDCPPPLGCAGPGVCAPQGPCAGDGDCPPGLARCDLLSAACVSCLTDIDCAAGELCMDGACLATGACGPQDGCPGERVCAPEGDRCLPAGGCPGDRFDAGAEIPELDLRTYEGLLLCDGDQDGYALRQPDGRGLRVVLWQGEGSGDLSLSLRTPPPGGVELGRSDGSLGVEVVELGPAAVGGERTVHAVVRGRAGWSVPYSLDFDVLPDGACPADALEGLTGNDTPGTALAAGAGDYDIHLCPDDEDWFAVHLVAGTTLEATLVAAAEADLDLLDSAGDVLLASGADVGGGWSVRHDILATGTYLLRARSAGAGGGVSARLQVGATPGPEAAQLACAEAVELQLGVPLQLRRHLPAPRMVLPGCAGGAQPETRDYVLRVDVAEPAPVSLQVTPALDVALIAACPPAPDSDVLCSPSSNPDWATLDLAPGVWFFVLSDPFGFQRPEVSLSLR